MDTLEQTIEDWEENFKPIINNEDTASWGGIMFETYNPDLDFVRKCPIEHIWSLIDGDESVWIVTGYHFVNRIGYFITEIPWVEECQLAIDEN